MQGLLCIMQKYALDIWQISLFILWVCLVFCASQLLLLSVTASFSDLQLAASRTGMQANLHTILFPYLYIFIYLAQGLNPRLCQNRQLA